MEKKNKKKTKSSDPWERSGERPGRGHGSELIVFFWFFHGFLQFGQKPDSRTQKKNKKFRPMGKVWAIHTQTKKTKNKKTRNQETKKTKNKKKRKDKTQHSASDPRPLGCAILFFFALFAFFAFFVFCFFGFLVSCFFVFCFFGLCVGSPDLAHGSELFCFCFLCSRGFGQTAKKHGKTKNKKPKKQKKDCTPQGEGVRCRVLGLVFLLFCFVFVFVFFCFCFFVLCVDSHCRCDKQRLPGTVSGCTRSKVDTLQYSNVCYDIVHSANEQQRGMELNFVRLRHMLLDLCTGNAAICALPQWPVLFQKDILVIQWIYTATMRCPRSIAFSWGPHNHNFTRTYGRFFSN